MGITGLIPFLKDSTEPINIRELKGKVLALDAYCFLHKGLCCCGFQLISGEKTTKHIEYCMRYVHMLLQYNIKPILVFDGMNLAAKKETNKKRSEARTQAKSRVSELMRLGKIDEARKYVVGAIDVTHQMAHDLIVECRKLNVDCVVAPYESDAQLSFLNSVLKIADYVVTEDSDLVLFGCTKILFKLDLAGNCLMLDADKLHLSLKVTKEQFSFDKFRHLCILSGCDYVKSLPGIGLIKAWKFLAKTVETDPSKFLRKIPSYLNMPKLTDCITEEYIDNFLKADATFRHMYVYDVIQRKMVRIHDLEEFETDQKYCVNAGEPLDDNTALQLALGNIDPHNLKKVFGRFDPDKNAPVKQKMMKYYCNHPSIWNRDNGDEDSNSFTYRTKSQEASKSGNQKLSAFWGKKTSVLNQKIPVYWGTPQKDENNDSEPPTQVMEESLYEIYKTENSSALETFDEIEIISAYSCAPPKEPEPKKHKPNSNHLGFFQITSKHTNPFPKKTIDSGTENLSNLSLVKKSNPFKKTVVDENHVVRSRFFKKEEVISPERVGIQDLRKMKLESEQKTESLRKLMAGQKSSSSSESKEFEGDEEEEAGASTSQKLWEVPSASQESNKENFGSEVENESEFQGFSEKDLGAEDVEDLETANDDEDLEAGKIDESFNEDQGNLSITEDFKTKSQESNEVSRNSLSKKLSLSKLSLQNHSSYENLESPKSDEDSTIEVQGSSRKTSVKSLSLSKFVFKMSASHKETSKTEEDGDAATKSSLETSFEASESTKSTLDSSYEANSQEVDDAIDVDSYQSKKSILIKSIKSTTTSKPGKCRKMGLSKNKTDPALQSKLSMFGFQKKPSIK